MDNPIVETTITTEVLNRILDEISKYEIDLADDPTQPHLKQNYLQKMVAQCRRFQNRVQYYMTLIRKHENELRRKVKQNELDLELKVNAKLADDPIVMKGPSIDDRKALAIMLLKAEYDELSKLKVELADVEEYYKIVKSKYDQLRQTATDIRMQRALVRDDLMERMAGGSGYGRPQTNQDGTVEGGLPPVVKTKPVEPKDLLDPSKRPDDMPPPIDEHHAQAMAEFLNKNPEKKESSDKHESQSVYESILD
jgi:hypothetical protein